MSDPHPVLCRFDDAELIAELERRTKAALRKASEIDTRPLEALTRGVAQEVEFQEYYGSDDWRSDACSGSIMLRKAI